LPTPSLIRIIPFARERAGRFRALPSAAELRRADHQQADNNKLRPQSDGVPPDALRGRVAPYAVVTRCRFESRVFDAMQRSLF
jgi:hypothetical protein